MSESLAVGGAVAGPDANARVQSALLVSLRLRAEAIILDITDKGPPSPSCPLDHAPMGLSGVAHHDEAVLLTDLNTFPRCAEASRTPGGLLRPPGRV